MADDNEIKNGVVYGPDNGPMPNGVVLGNIVFEKDYQHAIDIGLDMLKNNPTDNLVMVELMNAYFKGRALSPDYLDKSSFYAKQAMLHGHHTGYAEYRLAVNLDKQKQYHQSIQLYNLILDNPGFEFSPRGMGTGIDFKKRRDNALKQLGKATDIETDILFTDEEIERITRGIYQRKVDSILAKDRLESLDRKIKEAFKNHSSSEVIEKLLKEHNEASSKIL